VLAPLQALPPPARGAVGQAGRDGGFSEAGIGAWGCGVAVSLGAGPRSGAWGCAVAAVTGELCGAEPGGVGRRPWVASAGEAIAGASGGRLARVVAAGSVRPGIGAWGCDAPVSLGAGARSGAWGCGAAVSRGFSGAGRGGVGRRPWVASAGEAIAGASGGRLARVVAAGSAGRRIGAWGCAAPVSRGGRARTGAWGCAARAPRWAARAMAIAGFQGARPAVTARRWMRSAAVVMPPVGLGGGFSSGAWP